MMPADDGSASAYFSSMTEYVGFGPEDAQAIRQTRPILEKYLPEIMGDFYTHLLRYPPTRKFFLKTDGSVDQEYLELRMRHQTNFWLRLCQGQPDAELARFMDYVGRAHTARGADPRIYIAERYVTGQVGFMAHAITRAISQELHIADEDFELRALEAWNKLLMIVLEMLARAYGHEHRAEGQEAQVSINERAVERLAEEAYRLEQDKDQPVPRKRVLVAQAGEIPPGGRKIIQVEGLSIGIFHLQGEFYALRNSCLHRGGPVCTGKLEGQTLICPWHGFEYDVESGKLLIDPQARLDSYGVEVENGQLYLLLPQSSGQPQPAQPAPSLKPNQFLLSKLGPGATGLVQVEGQEVAVYNVEGTVFATQNACTHMEGPLCEGDLAGFIITCPFHGAQFDVRDGRVMAGPATQALKTYRVSLQDGIGTVEAS